MGIMNGIITFIVMDKTDRDNHAYLKARDGESIRIPGTMKDFDRLELFSQVSLQFENQFVRGAFRQEASNLLVIEAPFASRTVLGTIKGVTKKGAAFARCDTFEEDVFIGVDAFETADVKPGYGMTIVVTVGLKAEGFSGSDLIWKPEEVAVWRSKNLVAEEGVLKHFDKAKKFGHLRTTDGTQVFFHINGVAAELQERFYKDRGFRKGATFKYVMGDHHGKPTALITELVALAPEREVVAVEGAEAAESEDVAAEATAPADDVVTAPEVEVVAEPEAKPAKAPRKKTAAKPKAEPKVTKVAAPKDPSAKKVSKPKTNAPGGTMAAQLAALGLNGAAPNGATAH